MTMVSCPSPVVAGLSSRWYFESLERLGYLVGSDRARWRSMLVLLDKDPRVENPKEKDDSWAVDLKYSNPVLISLSLYVGTHVGDRPSCRHMFAERVRMEVLGDEMECCLTLHEGGILNRGEQKVRNEEDKTEG